ncbi:hypothetical protein A5733_26235 [Mycobacterium sp. NS-7484]|uniref:hypothetical protein n=1 Tax=Mycobacterium sp. NS-7484 TaxID=1834161 RepID=UPI00096D7D23|nr:hypothetical protein [Mycobacterium sp. NS-7484]OMC01981.1 hypothetical protein A5733_26235 [Mycobacterium sp. NS-7484]
MSIKIGTVNVDRVYAGSTPVEFVAVGATKIWEAPPLTYGGGGPGSTATAVPPAYDFTAPLNSDIFATVTTDRNATVSGVTAGGAAMTLIATVNHNNDATKGTTRVYRLAKGGDGTAKSIKATGSGTAWWIVNAFAIANVAVVGTPAYTYGNGTAPSQTVTGRGVWIVSTGNNGTIVGAFSGFTGVTNRQNLASGQGSSQAINTVDTAGTAAATLSTSGPWGAVFIPLGTQ